jgi:hypothetical protein
MTSWQTTSSVLQNGKIHLHFPIPKKNAFLYQELLPGGMQVMAQDTGSAFLTPYVQVVQILI